MIPTSHSTRVRGLKLRLSTIIFVVIPVALYTSAWIEIAEQFEYLDHYLCRTLHECVDWNYSREYDHCRKCHVALYTSAWIEIFSIGSHIYQVFVALYTSAWIEIM